MKYANKLNKHHLQIFHETKKRRIFVGDLIYHENKNIFELIYNQKYANSQNAIPLGPELSLFKQRHLSEKGKLFSSFIDRIPDRANPAYNDYCKSLGISPNEKNTIILLGTIGKRGPSSFIFEPVYDNEFSPDDMIKLREKLHITQHDLALAFNINLKTLQRIEKGISQDQGTIKQIQMILSFPEVAIWLLEQTGSKIHKDVLAKLLKYFKTI